MAKKTTTQRMPRDIVPALAEALKKLAGHKELQNRDAIPDGASYNISGRIVADVNGFTVSQGFAGELTVDHETVRQRVKRPKDVEWVAKLLALSTPQSRTHLLKLAGKIASAPEPTPELLEQAEQFLDAFSRTFDDPVKGRVKFDHKLR